MLGGKDLSRFRLLLVSIELIEEDAHDVFATPLRRVNALRDLYDPTYEVVDRFLVIGSVHLDAGVLLQQDVDLRVLATALLQRLGQGRVDSCMECRISQIDQAGQTHAVALSHERAGGEDHAMVEVLDAKLKMQAVVDLRGQLIDALLVDGIRVEQIEVVLDVV